jgi:MFS superfamily sulfate permease-like transporter
VLVATVVFATDVRRAPTRFVSHRLRYWKTWTYEHRSQLYLDVMIGLTVALAQVPEAIAFAFVAGMPPITGL